MLFYYGCVEGGLLLTLVVSLLNRCFPSDSEVSPILSNLRLGPFPEFFSHILIEVDSLDRKEMSRLSLPF